MLQATTSTAVEPIDPRPDRSDSGVLIGSAERVRQNVDRAVREESIPEATVLRANVSLSEPFTGSKEHISVRHVDFAPILPQLAPNSSLHALQEWEGYVVEVGESEFVARLVDVTAGASHEGEEATFPRAELSDIDDAKLSDGSIFRWVIGYERSPAGTKKRVSQIVFRDLPAITKSDLRDGEAWARDMAEALSP